MKAKPKGATSRPQELDVDREAQRERVGIYLSETVCTVDAGAFLHPEVRFL